MNQGKGKKKAKKKAKETEIPSEMTDQFNSDKFEFHLDEFLHNPIRLQIIAHLFSIERADMKYLKSFLNLTWGNLSFHTTKLEEKGYVSIKKDFIGKKPYTMVQITPLGIEKFEEYKKNMTSFLG